MKTKELDLKKKRIQIKYGFIILTLIFGMLILGYLAGKGLYHVLH